MAHGYKIYQGSKRLNPKGNLPLIIVVAQKQVGQAFTEHFIFTGLEKPALLFQATGYGTGRNVSQDEFDQLVNIDNLIGAQLESAKAHLENSLFEADGSLHGQLFLDGQKFKYEMVDDQPLIHLAMSKKCKSEIAEMLAKTQSQALEPLEKALQILSRIEVKPLV